jgi:hypothetical protein
MRRRHLLLCLVALGVVAALLRGVMLTRSNLWADEVFSIAVITGHSLEHPAAEADPEQGDWVEGEMGRTAEEWRQYLEHEQPPASLRRVVRAVRLSDTSPPFYYILLHFWSRLFGTGDVAIRSFSVLWSLACLPFIVGIARRTGGGRAVLGAVTLFTFSPIGVYYSYEARMYSLLWFLVVVLMWLTLVLRQRGGQPVKATLWVLAAAAGLYTHYFFLFPLAAAALYLFWMPGRLRRWHPVAAAAVVGALVLPWYVTLPQAMSAWRVTSGWLEMEPGRYHPITALRNLWLHWFTGESFYLWTMRTRWNAVGAFLFAVVAVLAAVRLRGRWFHGRRRLLWLWFGIVCVAPLLLDWWQGTYLIAVPRYVSTALPAAFILVGVALSCVRWRPQVVLLGLIVFSWLPTLWVIYRKNGRSGPPLRELAHTVSQQATAEDLILIHTIPSGVISFARYAHGPTPIAAWVGQLGQRTTPDSLLNLASGRTRILFIRFHDVGEPAPQEDWLREYAEVVGEQMFNGSRVTTFAPRGSPTF